MILGERPAIHRSTGQRSFDKTNEEPYFLPCLNSKAVRCPQSFRT